MPVLPDDACKKRKNDRCDCRRKQTHGDERGVIRPGVHLRQGVHKRRQGGQREDDHQSQPERPAWGSSGKPTCEERGRHTGCNPKPHGKRFGRDQSPKDVSGNIARHCFPQSS